MAWNTIAAAEVLEEFTPAEKAALENIQDAATQLAAILGRVVYAARGAILAGGNQLGAADTLPDQLRGEVIDLARWRWLIAFPQLKAFQTAERKAAAEAAQARVDKIADGTLRVEVPASPITSTSLVAGPSFGERDGADLREREFTRENQDG